MKQLSSNRIRCIFAVLLLVFCVQQPAFAKTASDIISGWGKGLLRFLTIIMGISSIVSVGFATYNILQGKSQEAKRLFYAFILLAVGTALMAFVNNYTQNIVITNGEGFEGIKADVKSVFQGVLALVGMISLAMNVINMLRGDDQAFRKLIVWIIALPIGSAMLAAV